MIRRGGFGTRLLERAAIYHPFDDFETCGAIHVHSISVGETQLAIKLIRKWREADPQQAFVIATGTATGHHLATSATLDGVRVTYSPLDFRSCVNRYLKRFEPTAIILVEAEVWPHLVLACHKRSIPIHLINARLSPRSARRFHRFAPFVAPMFRRLNGICIQESSDAACWENLGIPRDRIHHTGSLKFDPMGADPPARRPEFSSILARFGHNRPVILASSTHPKEEAWIATAIRASHPHALAIIVPRHAERRHEVAADLAKSGFLPILRSNLHGDFHSPDAVLVIDTTGELRDWTAHADVVIIGKSFLARGGQNPCEAIQAGKPVIVGPFMENFQPLTHQLLSAQAILGATGQSGLSSSIAHALKTDQSATLVQKSMATLDVHRGATLRTMNYIRRSIQSPPLDTNQ